MQTLIDCDVLDYCFDSVEDRGVALDRAVHAPHRPVYTVSVFELCRAFHFLVKFYGVSPCTFRECWTELVTTHEQYDWDGCVIHICEYPPEKERYRLPNRIRTLTIPDTSNEMEYKAPCEDDPERYWDRHFKLIRRLREFHTIELEDFESRFRSHSGAMRWQATPPIISRELPSIRETPTGEYDVVLDTNNLLELLNQLPSDGNSIEPNQLNLPSRLSDRAVRLFKDIVESWGMAGKLIVPLIALEEADHVAHSSNKEAKYRQAQAVLRSLSVEPDRSLWNIFDFEPLTQDIFHYLVLLFERIEVQYVNKQRWPDFGDALVLAHGLYHGCPVASNEWFEKQDWALVKAIFPHLVLE